MTPGGQRRSGINWSDVNASQIIADYGVFSSVAPITTRGFTGHEMVDDVGIIHMNGRIYDPKLARFLQADPFVQAPTDTQMLNRYSYVRNNPLNATDPSGHFIFTLAAIAWAAAQTTIQWYVAAAVFGAAAFGDALLQGASFKDALLSGVVAAFSAGAANGIAGSGGGLFGDVFGSELIGEAISMGLVGGISSVLQGGKFGNGFVSAGVSAAIGGAKWFKDMKSGGRIFTKAIMGGTFSKITGGKFANGAATAAMFAAVREAGRVSSLPSDRSIKTKPGYNQVGFSDEKIAETREQMKALSADLLKGNYSSAEDVYAALNDSSLPAFFGGLGIEGWAVIDPTTFSIKEIDTGFNSEYAVGIWDGKFDYGDLAWHTHPSSSDIHEGDYASAWGRSPMIYASSANGRMTGYPSISPPFNNADEAYRFTGSWDVRVNTYYKGSWSSGTSTITKPYIGHYTK